MSRPTILHLVHNLRREGVQVMIRNLVIAGSSVGRPVVCGWRSGGDIEKDLAAAGIEVIPPPGGGDRLSAWAGLYRHLRSSPVGLIHAHMSDSAILAHWLDRGGSIPFVVTHHSVRLVPKIDPLRRWMRWSLLRRAARAAAANVAVSDAVATEVASHLGVHGTALSVVDNGVPMPDLAAVAAARHRRARRGADATAPWPEIVIIGRLTEIKGQIDMIEALPRLVAAWPRIRITLVGDGTTREALEARARDLGVAAQLRLTGSVADVAPFLSGADLYVSTSHYEGLPMALIEAMAWGLPVAVSAVPGNRDAVADGVTGRLYPSRDVDALVATVSSLLEEADLSARLGEAARQSVFARYGADQMARAYDALYARSLSA